tara:strand:- start:21006 stop:21767 length:762 start_codon:yes stop_codon:yes gene_type:complete
MAFVPPTRPRDYKRYRRDQGRFRFWQTPAGNWRGQIKDGSARSFSWREPRGKYLNKDGRWTKIETTKSPTGKTRTQKKYAASPVMFAPKRKGVTDDAAMKAFEQVLYDTTKSGWSRRKLDPVLPTASERKGGRGHGSLQGWRSVSSFESTKPFLSTWHDLINAMDKINEDETISKAFNNRRAAIHIQYEDAEGVLHWTSPALATKFGITISQSKAEFLIWSMMYVAGSDDDDDDTTSDENMESAIHSIHLMIE